MKQPILDASIVWFSKMGEAGWKFVLWKTFAYVWYWPAVGSRDPVYMNVPETGLWFGRYLWSEMIPTPKDVLELRRENEP